MKLKDISEEVIKKAHYEVMRDRALALGIGEKKSLDEIFADPKILMEFMQMFLKISHATGDTLPDGVLSFYALGLMVGLRIAENKQDENHQPSAT